MEDIVVRPVGYDPEEEPMPTQPLEPVGGRKCPECPALLKTVDELAPHLERHREVHGPYIDPKTGKISSEECPKKCGRHFLRPSEYRDHTKICDGQPPIPKAAPVTPAERKVEESRRLEADAINKMTSSAKAEGAVRVRKSLDLGALFRKRQAKNGGTAMKTCPKCSQQVKDFRSHRKCPKAVAEGGSTPRPAPAKTNGAIRTAMDTLRDEAKALRERADKLETMAVELERLEL